LIHNLIRDANLGHVSRETDGLGSGFSRNSLRRGFDLLRVAAVNGDPASLTRQRHGGGKGKSA
jgi:hypothetical protein